MNHPIKQYKRELNRHLPLRFSARKKAIQRLQPAMDAFTEEHPAFTVEQMHAAFGSPEDMAQLLTQQSPPEEQAKYLRQKQQTKFLLWGLAVLVLLFAVYVCFFFEIPCIPHSQAAVQSIHHICF